MRLCVCEVLFILPWFFFSPIFTIYSRSQTELSKLHCMFKTFRTGTSDCNRIWRYHSCQNEEKMGLVVVCQKAVVFRGWTGAIVFPCNPCKQCCVWGAKQVGCQIVCMIYEHVSGMGTFSLSRCWCFALLFHPQLLFCLACDVLTCGTHVVDERPGGTRTGLLTCGNGALDHDGHPDWSYLLFRMLWHCSVPNCILTVCFNA